MQQPSERVNAFLAAHRPDPSCVLPNVGDWGLDSLNMVGLENSVFKLNLIHLNL